MLEREPISVATVAEPSIGVHNSFNTIGFMHKRGPSSVSFVGNVSADPHNSLNIINSILKRNPVSEIANEKPSENILSISGFILEKDHLYALNVRTLSTSPYTL